MPFFRMLKKDIFGDTELDEDGILRWPRSFEQNFRVVKWIVGLGYAAVRSGSGSK